MTLINHTKPSSHLSYHYPLDTEYTLMRCSSLRLIGYGSRKHKESLCLIQILFYFSPRSVHLAWILNFPILLFSLVELLAFGLSHLVSLSHLASLSRLVPFSLSEFSYLSWISSGHCLLVTMSYNVSPVPSDSPPNASNHTPITLNTSFHHSSGVSLGKNMRNTGPPLPNCYDSTPLSNSFSFS